MYFGISLTNHDDIKIQNIYFTKIIVIIKKFPTFIHNTCPDAAGPIALYTLKENNRPANEDNTRETKTTSHK